MSKRLKCTKAYGGEHDIVMIRIPCPQASHTRTGQPIKNRLVYPPNAVCLKCTRKAWTVDAVSKLPCQSKGVGGPKRFQLLARLLSIVENDAAEIDDRELAAQAYCALRPPEAQHGRPRNLRRYVWPLGKGPAAFCTACLRVAGRKGYLKASDCPGRPVWSPRRHAACAQLRAALPDPKPSRDARIRQLLALLSPDATPTVP